MLLNFSTAQDALNNVLYWLNITGLMPLVRITFGVLVFGSLLFSIVEAARGD